jgi:hypothetical protein
LCHRKFPQALYLHNITGNTWVTAAT